MGRKREAKAGAKKAAKKAADKAANIAPRVPPVDHDKRYAPPQAEYRSRQDAKTTARRKREEKDIAADKAQEKWRNPHVGNSKIPDGYVPTPKTMPGAPLPGKIAGRAPKKTFEPSDKRMPQETWATGHETKLKRPLPKPHQDQPVPDAPATAPSPAPSMEMGEESDTHVHRLNDSAEPIQKPASAGGTHQDATKSAQKAIPVARRTAKAAQQVSSRDAARMKRARAKVKRDADVVRSLAAKVAADRLNQQNIP